MRVYGRNVVKGLLDKKIKIKKVMLQNNFHDEIVKELKKKNIRIEYLEKDELDEMEFGHQGIIAEINDYEYGDINDVKEGKVVILDHLEDPHNLGAIIRTCEAAGIKNIIIPKDRSVKVTGVTYKTSAGAILNTNIILVSNIVNAINTLKKNGFWIVATDMEGEDYRKIDYSGNIGIVIGNEGKGITDLALKNSDFVASIPMNGEINSLNASVAAAIIIYEAMRSEI